MAETLAESTGPKDSPERAIRGGLRVLIKPALFIGVLVGVEVTLGALLFPSAHDTEALARQLELAKEGGAELAASDAITADGASHREALQEVELGTFSVTRYDPQTEKTLSIDFELFATVQAQEAQAFLDQFQVNRNRVREQIIITLHGADASDLTDAGLGLIKRTILEKTNRALGKPFVREVLLSKFNFVER